MSFEHLFDFRLISLIHFWNWTGILLGFIKFPVEQLEHGLVLCELLVVREQEGNHTECGHHQGTKVRDEVGEKSVFPRCLSGALTLDYRGTIHASGRLLVGALEHAPANE